MSKKLSKQKTNMVFKKIFKGHALELHDVIMYLKGRVLWEVYWKTEKGYYLVSVPAHSTGRYLYPRDFDRIFLVKKVELLKWLLRHDPSRVTRYFRDPNKLLRLMKRIVPAPNLKA